MSVCSCHVTYAFQSESTLCSCLNVRELLARTSLAKWLSVRLRTKWFWVRVQLQSLHYLLFQRNLIFIKFQVLSSSVRGWCRKIYLERHSENSFLLKLKTADIFWFNPFCHIVEKWPNILEKSFILLKNWIKRTYFAKKNWKHFQFTVRGSVEPLKIWKIY